MANQPFVIVHALNQRVRLKVPRIWRDPEKAYVLEILLRKQPGIKQVEVNPRSSGVIVSFDPDELPRERLLALVGTLAARLPRQSRAVPSARKKRQPGQAVVQSVCAVEGMTCQSCSLLIELVLGRLVSVERAQVNYASGTATVDGTATREEIFAAIAKLGYTPRPLDTLSQRLLLIERERERLAASKRRLIVAAVLGVPVLVAGMSMSPAFLPRFISLAFTTPLVFGAGKPFFSKSWMLARQGQANMDTLIALGSGAAYFYSVYALLGRKRHLYFESAAGIIVLILLGRYLEERARGKASEAIRKLVELQPLTATVIRAGEELEVGIDDVAVGDELIVRPGERVPVDGEVSFGQTTVDEALISGESLPVAKEPGAALTGGTINLSGSVRFHATAVGGDTVLAGIIKMVDQAQSAKVPVQRLADRISAVFVPAVIVVAGFTFLGWKLAGYTLARAMMNSVSVLLISCPCSLGLATPTAVMAGTGSAAKQGIYIRSAEGLERAGGLDVLILDKTGTLTEGHPAVTDFINSSDLPDRRLLQLMAAAEHGSEHFAGQAVLAYALAQGVEVAAAESFQALVGRGIEARVEGVEVIAGNELLFQERRIALDGLADQGERLSREGKTPVFVALDGSAAGLMAVADRPRESSAAAVARLKQLGIDTVMVTGDNPATGRYIADLVGIEEVVAFATPARKVEVIQALRRQGLNVGMIGDGVNDAPALAEADVGFAIGTGTDIAMEAAHITLVGGDIAKAAAAIELSRKTMAIIRENLFWAFAYNTLAIPLAAAGALTPTIASGAMAVSSVSVVANSLRLQKGAAPQ